MTQKLLASLKIILFALFSLQSLAQIWDSENRWSRYYEDKYSEFVRTMSPTIFSDPNSKYYGIQTDCADAVYTPRIIFSYENKLPYKIKDSTNSKRYVSSDLMRWNGKPDKVRLFNFINLINALTTTYTMQFDTYPAKLNNDYIRSGTVYLHPTTKTRRIWNYGHAYLVKSQGGGFISYFSSTSPRTVRKLSIRRGHDYAPFTTGGGYRLWRQPFHYHHENEELPGFSLEQFQIGGWKEGMKKEGEISKWQTAVRMKLGQARPSFEESVDAHLENICGLLADRAFVVTKAYELAQSLNGDCMSTLDFDDYSTPSRDKKIAAEYRKLENVLDLRNWTIEDVSERLQKCTFEIEKGKYLNAFQVFKTFKDELAASDPHFKPAARWGLEPFDPNHRPCQ